MWAINLADADESEMVSCRTKSSPRESDGVVGCPYSSKGLTFLVILNKETVDHSCYIKNVLPVALKYGDEVSGDKWISQQDGANSHRDHLTEERCRDNFPSLIDKDRWPPNSPDLNPLDESIWDEVVNVIDWNKVRSKTGDTE